MSQSLSIPTHADLLWPTLRAVRALGGSGSIGEINAKVIEAEGFTEAQQSVPHGDGPQSKIEYRLAWSRTYLKGMGLLHNSARGVWTATESGQQVDAAAIPQLLAEFSQRQRRSRNGGRRASEAAQVTQGDNGDVASSEQGWKEQLLEVLLAMSPSGFERLAQRLLREAGFISATVTGRSGDGGIDGMGVYRASLISFPVYFQCKRYRGSVGPSVVRDFRGAMAGRGDKGLLVTTASFTGEAKREASRDGAPPIDLIDGDELCELLKRYAIGVDTTVEQVEHVTVRPEFFASV